MFSEKDQDIINNFASGILQQTGVNFPQEFRLQFQGMLKFQLALRDETDRGCALMAASFLDNRIKQLIERQLISDKCTDELLSPSGPIGTFSNRINIAFSMALIPSAMRRDLHILRKIRNDFAHESIPISFETDHIKNKCYELQYAGENRKSLTPKDCFTFAMLAIDGSICVYTIEAEKKIQTQDENFEIRETMLSELKSKIKF